jgi:hypothetical protein
MATYKILLASACLGAPFMLWLALYVVARYSAINMRRTVPWVRAIRWATWLTTLVLFLVHFVWSHFPAMYAFLSLSFSSGVILVDSWAIRRFAPERVPAGTDHIALNIARGRDFE